MVKLKDAVAVVADRHWRAQAALDKLAIEWEVGAAGTTDSVQFRGTDGWFGPWMVRDISIWAL